MNRQEAGGRRRAVARVVVALVVLGGLAVAAGPTSAPASATTMTGHIRVDPK